MSRLVHVCLIVAAVLSLTACTSDQRSGDPAGAALRGAHSSVASLVLAVRLMLDARATTAVTQVALEESLEEVASAQRQLVTATDADPQRRAVASAAVRAATDTLVALDNRGAGELGRSDLDRLEQAERVLAAAARELRA